MVVVHLALAVRHGVDEDDVDVARSEVRRVDLGL
eukprot:CAMPEP_0197420206 /NCGR_PEP_ID=MMETSP1170-20131217/5680_1 /TAXON_ID=54406 /ORGANISM="Sarcinochrysis sp, Strain CCMP770" /LENGTH=33 /DNA_ID= /DNA_START= /DNA_END= /DNA_ORIENTATION=